MQSRSAQVMDHEKMLLRRIAEDDEAAFVELFRTYCILLGPFVEKLLNSAFWAEEIVQDVFLKIWMNRKELNHIDNPSAYIHRMAANKCFDFLKQKAKEVKMQYHLAKIMEQGVNFTEQWTDFHISEELYKEAISKLSPQRALVYRMKYEEGLNYSEIVRYLKISKNTIRNHLVAAMDQIRNYLLHTR